MAYYEWRFQITRPGADYGINKDSLVSRLEMAVVSSASCPMLSVGGGARDDVYIRGINEQHLHYVLDSKTLTLKCRGPVKFTTRGQEKDLKLGDKFTLDLAPANYNHKIVFPNGVEIIAKYRQEVETLLPDNQRFLEDKYGPLQKLHEGNSSLLYKTGSGKVLKILRPTLAGNKAVAKRFRNAAKRFRKISAAPFFTRVQSIELHPDRQLYYVVMEYCEGETLKNYLARKGVLPVTEARDIACSIAKRLAVMGRYHYCCRNLTPANILLGKDGEARITGFFLVKSEEGAVTLPGARMVISSHSAPEQIQSAKEADIQADMFSLGTIFYMMLVGEPPIATLNSLEYEQLLFSKGMPKEQEIQTIARHIPPGVCQLIAGLLSFNKKERPDPKHFLRFFGEKLATRGRQPAPALAPENSIPLEHREYRAPTPPSNAPMVVMLLSLAIMLVIGYWYWSRQRSSEMTFSRHLPDQTRAVMAFPSLSNFLAKIDLPSYPDFYNSAKGLSEQMLGGNISDPEFFRSFGFDPDGPLGFALIGDPISNPRVLVFIKVGDYGQMLSSMQDQQKFRWFKLQQSKIAGVRCLVNNEEQPSFIMYSQGDYAFAYFSKNREKIIANFEQDIAAPDKTLAQHTPFRESIQRVRSIGDLFFYIDGRTLAMSQDLLSRQNPNATNRAKSAMFTDEILGYIFSLEFTNNGMTIANYMHLRQDSRLAGIYRTVPYNETSKFLQSIVGDPVACLYVNHDIAASWPIIKPIINEALKQDRRFSTSNIDESMQRVQQGLAEMGIQLDIEKQLLLNFQGQQLIAVYSLPASMEKLDFSALIAASLKDSEQTRQLLQQIAAKVGPEVCKQQKIAGSTAFSFTLPAAPPNKLTVTVGTVNNCLLITTNHELFSKIANQQYDYAAELEILDQVMAKGFIKLDRVWAKLHAWQKMAPPDVAAYLPMLSTAFEKFYEANWTATVEPQGVSQYYQIQSSKSLFAIVFQAITDWKKQMASRRPVRRPRIQRPLRRPNNGRQLPNNGRQLPPISFTPPPTPSSGYLAKQTVGGIELKLAKIGQVQDALVFYFERGLDGNDYQTSIKIDGFKSAGYSGFTMGSSVSFQQNMQPESKDIPSAVDMTLTLSRKARYQDAEACIDITLPPINQCQAFDKSVKNAHVELQLLRAGIFQDKGVNTFAFGKVEQQYDFGKKKIYVYTKKNNQKWYEILVQGAIPGKHFSKKNRNNLILFDPDKKFFGGKLNLTLNFSEDGAKTNFAFCGPLFKHMSKRVKLCYFSDDYYQKGKKVFQFKNIRLK